MENVLLEGFKWCEGFEGLYSINIDGEVCSHHFGKIKLLVGGINKETGYKTFCLSLNKRKVTAYAHRLIAVNFIPNPDNKPCINHIDHDKSNNQISNLEWCTYSENTKAMFDFHGVENLAEFRKINIMMTDSDLKLFVTEGYMGKYKTTTNIYTRLIEQPESFWIELGVPSSIMRIFKRSKLGTSILDMWKDIINTIDLIKEGHSLSHISRLTGKDRTLISKIKTGTRWKTETDLYNKFRNNPDFIKFI